MGIHDLGVPQEQVFRAIHIVGYAGRGAGGPGKINLLVGACGNQGGRRLDFGENQSGGRISQQHIELAGFK